MPRNPIPIFVERGKVFCRLYDLQELGKRAPTALLCSLEELEYFENGRKRTDAQQHAYLRKRLAEVKARRLEAAAAAKEQRQHVRFKDAVQLYLDDQAQSQKAKTQQHTIKMAEHFLSFCGNLQIAEIKPLDGKKFCQGLAANNLKAASIRSYLRHLKAVLNWCVEQELMPRVPKFQQPNLPQKEPKVFTPEQIAMFEAHLRDLVEHGQKEWKKDYVQHLRTFMMLTQTGCRIGEALYLPLERIHVTEGYIEIKEVSGVWNPKGNKEGILPITNRLKDFLIEDFLGRHPEEKFYLDNGFGRPRYKDHMALSKAFIKHQKRLGIRGPKALHGFRASVATHLLGEGLDSMALQRLLRHSSVSTTNLYVASSKELVKGAVDRLEWGKAREEN
jgi:site-specific recombinase XerD